MAAVIALPMPGKLSSDAPSFAPSSSGPIWAAPLPLPASRRAPADAFAKDVQRPPPFAGAGGAHSVRGPTPPGLPSGALPNQSGWPAARYLPVPVMDAYGRAYPGMYNPFPYGQVLPEPERRKRRTRRSKRKPKCRKASEKGQERDASPSGPHDSSSTSCDEGEGPEEAGQAASPLAEPSVPVTPSAPAAKPTILLLPAPAYVKAAPKANELAVVCTPAGQQVHLMPGVRNVPASMRVQQ